MGLPDIETIPETGAVFTIGRSRFADNIASHFFIRKDPVIAITCGDEHSAVVCQTGRLFVFGSNDWGQLGLGHKNHISKPSCVKILKPEKVTQVACGRAHTLICTSNQKIFACGSNQEGQLGRESSAIGDSCSSPILVYDCGLAGPKIVQIAAGSHHSMALTSDGGVVAWGSNLEGQLGLSGISGLVNKPTKVPITEPVKEISAGYYHSAFLTESGLVYVCGESESGKLGIDVNFSAQVAPKQMQLPVPALHVACGGHHTLVLAENGNIYCCGSNANGQLGMGTSVTEVHTPKFLSRDALRDETIVKIACGESHSAIVTESGKLFTCGDGRHGKLGLEENENNVHDLTFAIKYQELLVSNVACGGCHTILIGRRHEINYQSQRQSNSAEEQSAQKKNSLPPLKLPVNMQNEQRVDNTENKSMNEKHDSSYNDKINDKLENDNSRINSSNDTSKRNLKIHDDSSANDENVSDSKKSSKSETDEKNEKETTESQLTVSENELENKEGTPNDENTENKDSNTNNNDQENNEKITEMTKQDTESSHAEDSMSQTHNENEQELSTNNTPPQKPPRLKSVSIEEDIHNEKKSQEDEDNASREEEASKKETEIINEQDSSPKLSDEKVNSTITDIGNEENIETVEDSIEKIDGDGCVAKVEKTEVEIDTQDDADVVQSPAPRTSKMAKLFKTKRQQQIQNGTKRSSTTNPKSKSKTCTIL